MNREIQPVLSGIIGTKIALGEKVSFEQALEIINRMRKNSVPDSCCFKYIYTRLDYVAQSNQYAPAEKNEIGTLCIRPNFTQNTCMRCCANRASTNMTAREMLDTCAKNIENGHCRDKFMQYIVGDTLFPHFYNKQKER